MAGVIGLGATATFTTNMLRPVAAKAGTDPLADIHLAGTDGWISLPASPAISYFHPDSLAPQPADGAPPGLTTYVFGFHDVSALSNAASVNSAEAEQLIRDQKSHAQHSAPLFWVDQDDPVHPTPFKVQVTNLGLALRPDLTDAHTLHWHGFRNATVFFDGEPTGSFGIPPGRDFTYVYIPHDPGTYMYHCHVEDVEHVQMGMTGLVFIRPAQNGTPYLVDGKTFTKFVQNDGDGSTGYDREYALFFSDFWAEAHWADAHIQLPEWSDYHVDFALMNGRAYPDTIAPNGAGFDVQEDPGNLGHLIGTGDYLPPPGHPNLKYQPLSSLIQANEGDHVLLRMSNLGFFETSMKMTGITGRVVGKDAVLLRGRDGTDHAYETDNIIIGAGESADVIFQAPAHSTGTAGDPPDVYYLFDRTYSHTNNLGGGGRMTEIHVYPAATLPEQVYPNDLPEALVPPKLRVTP